MAMRLFRWILSSLLVFTAFVSAGEIYKNPTLGFQIEKPDEWYFVTAEQVADNLKQMKVGSSEFQAAVQKYGTSPLVAMAKFEEPHDDLNPSIKVNLRPFGPLKGRSGEELIRVILPTLQRSMKDFKVIQAPEAVTLDGVSAGHARFAYTLVLEEEVSISVASDIWIVPRGDYFFMIGAGIRADESNGSQEEIAAIVKTVRFAHQ